ncbi:MAG: hypothetical protein RLZZ609_412 [Cyanobacteriota bacterium]|jgi:hypothetical protein
MHDRFDRRGGYHDLGLLAGIQFLELGIDGQPRLLLAIGSAFSPSNATTVTGSRGRRAGSMNSGSPWVLPPP